jgi:hypothetical protein
MSNHTLTIEYTDDLLFRLGVSREVFSDEAKFLLAAKPYELGRLSSGEAAVIELALQENIALIPKHKEYGKESGII